jgi:hypothetical protein
LRSLCAPRRSEDGRVITPREYLEAALRLAPGDSAAVQSKNQARHPPLFIYFHPISADTGGRHLQIRRSIASLFPNRDCFTLVRPVNDEKQLQNLDSAPPSPQHKTSAVPNSVGTRR